MKQLVTGIFSGARWRAVGALAFIAGVTLTEGVSLLLLIPLLQLAGVPVEGSAGRISAGIGRLFAAFNLRPTLAAVLLLYIVVTAFQATLARAQTLAALDVVQEYALSLRARLYRAIARAEWLVLSRIRSSDFTFALTTAVDRVTGAADQLLYFTAGAAVALLYVVIAFAVSPVISAIVLGAAALLLVAQRGRLMRTERPGAELTDTSTELYATAAEQLGGLKTAKSYGQEERHFDLFMDASGRVNRASRSLTIAYADFRWLLTVGSVVALAAILFLAVQTFRLPTAVILLLLFIFSRLVPRLVTLQQTLQYIVGALPALRAITDLTKRCEESPEQRTSERLPIELDGGITLRGVSFSYQPDSATGQLSGVNLTLPSGATTAIVGASGAGKSTLADLVMGLIRPSDGEVLVGSAKLDPAHLQSWRGQLGYVAQDTFLFNSSVRENLAWAKPAATEEEMWDALRLAAADDFVGAFSDGLDTLIGERGVRLSGGERQRLSLARALLRKPRLLILDEATSSLDSENELRVFSAIERLRGAMTILIITHRLATIRDADVIHVLDRGRVVASGDWTALVNGDNPRFRDLCLAQGIGDVTTVLPQGSHASQFSTP